MRGRKGGSNQGIVKLTQENQEMELWEVGDWGKEHGEGGMLVKGELEFQHTYLEQHYVEQWF